MQETMKRKNKKISIETVLFYFVMLKIISPEEASLALKTGLLPDDVMIRLSLKDKASKN